MHYLVYRTSCLINGKIYVGKHVTESLTDTYLGSGKLLLLAIRRYGRANFVRTVLFDFDCAWKMDMAERILVISDSETSYNLKRGGDGGWDYISKLGLFQRERGGARSNQSTRKREKSRQHGLRLKAQKRGIFEPKRYGRSGFCAPEVLPIMCQRAASDQAKIKRRATMRQIGHQQGFKNSQFGRPRSEQTRLKISEGVKRSLQKNAPFV